MSISSCIIVLYIVISLFPYAPGRLHAVKYYLYEFSSYSPLGKIENVYVVQTVQRRTLIFRAVRFVFVFSTNLYVFMFSKLT